MVHKVYSFISDSAIKTMEIGKEIGKQLVANHVVCFFGDLGAGKTTLIKGIYQAVGEQKERDPVNSPTFTYLNIYQAAIPLYHFDLYRLSHADQFLSMGFDEYLYAGGICCIEWSERIASLLPAGCWRVEIVTRENSKREIKVQKP